MPIKDYGNDGDGTDNNEQPVIIGERITAFNVTSKIRAQITNLDDHTLLKNPTTLMVEIFEVANI